MIPSLPRIMIAPNGARRMKTDHRALPITVTETVEAAKACFDAGADALHAHVRDREGKHVLDAHLYQDLIAVMAEQVPDMLVQITTEAVGMYSAKEQRDLVDAVKPRSVSVALREQIPNAPYDAARDFYHQSWQNSIAVQHILYSPDEFKQLLRYVDAGVIPPDNLQCLFVMGRYNKDFQSNLSELDPFLALIRATQADFATDWAVCAFGFAETDCLVAALKAGGKARVGFENSLWHKDGSLARNNADRVREIVRLMPES